MAGRDTPPDALRCVWIKANGSRCQQERTNASAQWCLWHEEAAAARVSRWHLADNVPDVPIEQHLQMLLKMGWVMCKELEFQVLDLGLSMTAYERDVVETEERDGADDKNSYVSRKTAREMGAHPVILHYLKEREQHQQVVKLCISAGIAARQVAVLERYVETLIASQMSLAEALGHDPNDPMTRRTIMEVVRRQQAELEDLR